METKLNVPKGVTTLSPQIVFGEGIMQAQVWDSTGKSMILIEPTDDPAVATNIAILCSNAINVHDATGYTPSQLLEQNRELLEALEKCVTRIEFMEQYTEDSLDPYSKKGEFRELLTKHSKDV